MFKFFRRIRKNLLDKGQLRKYLPYAIGEIFLVVVGILIALQINNWNQNRVNKQLETNYLNNLAINVENDIRRMNELIIKRYDQKMEGLRLAKSYAQGQYQVKDTIDFLLKVSYGAVFAQGVDFFNTQTYNELISTGNLRLISDDELKTKINNYYGFVRAQISNIRNYQGGYITFINSLRSFDELNKRSITKLDQKLMIEELKSKEALYLINTELTYGSRVYTLIQPLTRSATSLLENINQYLDK